MCLYFVMEVSREGRRLFPQPACISLWCKSNLHCLGWFYGICKYLSIKCLSFVFILMVPRVFWLSYWQNKLYNVLWNADAFLLGWSPTHYWAHKQTIGRGYRSPSTHQHNPASTVYLKIFFNWFLVHILRSCIISIA